MCVLVAPEDYTKARGWRCNVASVEMRPMPMTSSNEVQPQRTQKRKERIDKMKKQTKAIFVTSLAFAAVGAEMMLQEERS